MEELYIQFNKPLAEEEKQKLYRNAMKVEWHNEYQDATVIAEYDYVRKGFPKCTVWREYLIRYQDEYISNENEKHKMVSIIETYNAKHIVWQRYAKCERAWVKDVDIEKIKALPEVIYIEANELIQFGNEMVQETTYSIVVTDIKEHGHDQGYDGEGKSVCHIDSAIRHTHEDLPLLQKALYFDDDRNPHEYDRSTDGDEIPEGVSSPYDLDEFPRLANHGTLTIGSIFMQDNSVGGIGTAPGANMMHVNRDRYHETEDLPFNTGDTGYIIDGIYWAVDNGADSISISFSVNAGHGGFREACAYAKSHGVHVCLSAGNFADDPDRPNSAREGNNDMLNVGAVHRDSSAPHGVTRSSYSAIGPYLHFMAPTGIKSTGPESDDHYCYASGTSTSSPVLAGIIAVVKSAYLQGDGESGEQYWERIRNILIDTCITDIPNSNDSDPNYIGYGMPVIHDLSDIDIDPTLNPPRVRAYPATEVTTVSAKLHGEVETLGYADEVWVQLLYKEDLGIHEPFIAAKWPESEYEDYPEYPTSGLGFYNLWRHNAVKYRTAIKITEPGSFSVVIDNLDPNKDYIFTSTGTYIDNDNVMMLQICERFDVEDPDEYSDEEAMELSALSFETEEGTKEPIFATLSPIDITDTSATIRGEVVDAGADDPQRNLQWGYSPEPGDMSNHIDFGVGGVGIYSAEITGLKKGSAYYYRAYGISSYGYDFGETIQFYADGEEEEAPAEYAYRIHRQVGGGPWEIVGHVEDENTMTWDDESEFQVNQDYHYQVVKIIESDDLWSNVATVTWNEYGMFGIMGAVPFNRIYTKPGSHFELTSGLQTETRKYIPDATETEDVATVILETFTRKSEYLGLRIGTKFNRFPGIITYNPRFQTRADFSINSLKNIKLTSEFTVSTEFTIETRKALIHVPDVLKVYVVPEFNQPNLIQPELPPLSMPRVNKQRIEMQMINLSTGEYYDLIGCDVIFHVKPNRYTLDPVIEKTVNNGISISGYGVFAIELDTQDLELPATDYLYGLTVGDGNKFHRLTLGTFRLLP